MITSDYKLPKETAALIDAELRPGERIAWIGQPIPWRLARKSLPLVIFGIPWTAFAVFWTLMAARPSTSGTAVEGEADALSQLFRFFPLFGVPFILVGLALLSFPYWLSREARRTAYVITDQRALIIDAHGWRAVSLRSFEPKRLTDLSRTQSSDGSGDVIFERQRHSHTEGSDTTTDVGFLAVRNVKEVESLLRALVAKSGA